MDPRPVGRDLAALLASPSLTPLGALLGPAAVGLAVSRIDTVSVEPCLTAVSLGPRLGQTLNVKVLQAVRVAK